jgi:hypothetical protein
MNPRRKILAGLQLVVLLLMVGGMALVIGLAFGLDGQKVAGKQLEEWSEALKSEDAGTE